MVHKFVSAPPREAVEKQPQSNAIQQFAQELARTAHTDSFFVGDLGKVRRLVEEWRVRLPRVRAFYSLNCNAAESLLRALSSFPRMGFHCATRAHMETALQFAEPERVFFSNALWTRQTLASASANEIALLGFESERDLSRMAACGVKNKLILNICADSQLGGDIGCEVAKAPELLRLAADLGLDCAGVGFVSSGGGGVQRAAHLGSLIECAAQLFEVGQAVGLQMRVLNLGGGFPNLFSAEAPSLEAVAEEVNASLDYYFPTAIYGDLEVIATPGRFFAASVFSLATKIVEKFEVDASAITKDDFDAGHKAFLYKITQGYYGAFGCRMMASCEPRCLPLFAGGRDDAAAAAAGDTVLGSVLGPHAGLEEDADVVLEACRLRPMSVGEWLLWPSMGAYTMNGNSTSLDDYDEEEDEHGPPNIYYFKENEWNYTQYATTAREEELDALSDDGERESLQGESDSDEPAEDVLLWTFDWPLV